MATATDRIRLAVVTTHPIQYQAPIWRLLSQDPLLDVHVYFGSDLSVRGYFDRGFGIMVRWDVPLTHGYAHTFLSSEDMFDRLRPRGLRRHLLDFKPDAALICGYTPWYYWEVLAVLRSLQIPVLIRAETTDAAKDRGPAKRIARSILLRCFYGQISRFLAIGHNSRAHYLAHGIPASRIGWAPYCIDNDMFEKQVETFVPQRRVLRQELGFSNDHTVFLFVGKLITVKDPLLLPAALAGMSEIEREKVGLIVVGDGELRPSMEALCRPLLNDRAVFTGFLNQGQLGRYYAAADCLVLPSLNSETWGLVVNEALQFGLPALVSDRVGCHPDLIIPGKTGLVFKRQSPEALRAGMREMGELLARKRQEISEACRHRVLLYSSQVATEGICRAVVDLQSKSRRWKYGGADKTASANSAR